MCLTITRYFAYLKVTTNLSSGEMHSRKLDCFSIQSLIYIPKRQGRRYHVCKVCTAHGRPGIGAAKADTTTHQKSLIKNNDSISISNILNKCFI